MYLEIFLADFGVFRGISRKSLNFAGPRPREISEALNIICDVVLKKKKTYDVRSSVSFKSHTIYVNTLLMCT